MNQACDLGTQRLGKRPSVMSESISIVVDGMNVEGEIVHRSGSDIEVRITSPYQGFREECTSPTLLASTLQTDYRGPHGDETAVGLLKDLFLLGNFVEENTRILKTRLVTRMPPSRALTRNGSRARACSEKSDAICGPDCAMATSTTSSISSF